MNSLERPVFIKTTAPKPGAKPDGVAFFDLKNQKDGTINKVEMPIWVNKVGFIQNGMSWFTHRRVFRQLSSCKYPWWRAYFLALISSFFSEGWLNGL